jgi:hypothetical protein
LIELQTIRRRKRMAYLREINSICEAHGCIKGAFVELFSHDNYSIGKYCRRHGNEKLKSLNKEERSK